MQGENKSKHVLRAHLENDIEMRYEQGLQPKVHDEPLQLGLQNIQVQGGR